MERNHIFLLAHIGLDMCLLVFLLTNVARTLSVKSTHQHYRLTGWMWALLWPAYATPLMWTVTAIVTHDPFPLVFALLVIWLVRSVHRELHDSDDDNPWRTLKGKIKAGLKRLRQVRVPAPRRAAPISVPNAA